jgi:acyl carrier protein
VTSLPNELSTRIADLISETLHVDVPSHDADLIDEGLIDSLALISVITEIEAEFEVQLPLDEFDIDSARSVDRLAAYVGAHLPGSGTG